MLDNELTTNDITEPWKHCKAFRRTIKLVFGILVALNIGALACIIAL